MADELPDTRTPEIASTYDLVGRTALVSKAKGFETEVGDTRQESFFPQVKIKRWDNEANFSVRLLDADPSRATLTYTTNRIVWEKGDLEARFYDRGFGEDVGGFAFDLLLKAVPPSNVITYTIQAKGLEFIYQPPLTARDVADGVVRADNVNGSYAVYHTARRGNRYKNGKAFHVYRPFARDRAGVETWGDLDIDLPRGLLTITFPPGYFESAVYPVLIDPDFGYTTIGGSANTHTLDFAYSNPVTFSPAADGTVQSFSLATNGVGTWKGGLYAAGALVGSTHANTGTGSGWSTATCATPFNVLAATAYLLAFKNSSSSQSHNWDAGGAGNTTFAASTYANDFPGTTPAGDLGVDRKYSLYATYTEAPPAATSLSVSAPLRRQAGNSILRPRSSAPGLGR